MSDDGKLDLLPCRRCQQLDAEVFANDGWYTVECNNCPCRTSGADRTAVDAVAAWNRPPAGAGEVVVPREPDHYMGIAGFRKAQEPAVDGLPLFDRCVAIYRAMIAAAPAIELSGNSGELPVPTNTVGGEVVRQIIHDMVAITTDPRSPSSARVKESCIRRLETIASPDTTSRDSVIDMLIEARNQIEYLHGKFQETGSGNAVIAKLDDLRHKLQAKP